MTGNGYYTPAENALDLLSARQSLRSTIEEWWRENGWEPILPSLPNLAVLARQIAAFRYEDCVYHSLADSVGLTPVCLELTSDRMSSKSNYKRSLIRPVYFERFGRNGGMATKREKLASIDDWYGHPLKSIVLKDGTSLLDYHHARYDAAFGADRRADNSSWMQALGGARDYYPLFLSIFLAHAILFEDYHGGESGLKLDLLTVEIFEPTFEALAKQFGVVPLIVRMPWTPELALHPPDTNWREHKVIPDQLLNPVTVP